MFPEIKHLTTEELEAGLEEIRKSPKDGGLLELIVRRPKTNEREILHEARLDLVEGLVGDSWKNRSSFHTPDGLANPETQLNIINSRVISLVAQTRDRWPLAGDQLYLDMDLSKENLPAGTRFQLGSAVIEVTAPPHTGCKKFVARFGLDAMMFVNSPLGRELCLRGINAKVVQSGVIRVGEFARRIVDGAT